MRKEREGLVSFTAIFVLFLALGSLLYFSATPAYAGDHLSASPGCTKCHGTNVRQVHDYEDTIPLDCDICHSTGGDTWYINSTCKDYLEEGGVPVAFVEGVEPSSWVLDLPEYVDFSFECKACHKRPDHKR